MRIVDITIIIIIISKDTLMMDARGCILLTQLKNQQNEAFRWNCHIFRMCPLLIRFAPWSWSSFVARNLRFSAAQMFPLVQCYHFHVPCLRQYASLPKTLLSILHSKVVQTLLRALQIKWKLTKIRSGTDTKWLILLLILDLQQRYYASCIIIIIIIITTIYFFRYKWCIKKQRIKWHINE